MNKAATPTIQQHLPFGLNTTQAEAKAFLETHALTHYPVVEARAYIGSVLAEDVFVLESQQTLEVLKHDLEPFAISPQDKGFDILEQCAQHQTNMVPIVDAQKHYIGYYRYEDLMDFFSNTPFFSERAITLIIEKDHQKYSFSEISHIVESNHSTLLGLYIAGTTDNTTEILLKINSDNINEVIQAFRRYDYEILSNHSEDAYNNELQERSEYLNKYLNI
ncbi:acetoin utilization protein acuB [Flavobacterium sp. JP2137]|uniref:acetoin utilization protein acuB n=1 Tax=Flavobacterium sp. JP2137 TaxID=3414510 RepID=UPI003D2FFE5E